MLIVFASRTGNVRRFMNKTGFEAVQLTKDLIVNEPFLLVTYTDKMGAVPGEVASFLENNSQYLRGVAASGNRNWGKLFANSADIISALYSVPIILKFEMAGTKIEVDLFVKEVAEFEAHRTKQHGHAER